MEKNLGHATAYGYAKSKGYSGTEDEFAELMADYASVGQSAAQSAEQAAASATSASGSAATAASAAQTATDKASEAVTAAGTSTTKASEASQSASTASAAATSATTSAQTATTAAATATTKASEASESAATATTAKTDAESARDAAAQSASEAAASAESIDPDEFNRKIYAAFATDTASGSIASFADGADSIPMKDVLVHIEPMQAGSGDPSPDNVRPITGWTGAKVTRCGKNLLWKARQSSTMNGITWTLNDDGSITASGTSTGRSYIMVLINTRDVYTLPKGTYTYSLTPTGSDYANIKSLIGSYKGTEYYKNVCLVNNLNHFANKFTWNDSDLTATLNIAIEVADANKTVNCTVYPQIELGSTATDYEPYSEQTYDITFPTEAGTVYGGTLDVTKGELAVDRAMVDLGTLNWEIDGTRFKTSVDGMPNKAGRTIKMLCDCYKSLVNGEAYDQNVNNVCYGAYDRVYVHDFAYTDASIFKTAVTGHQLVYELATPITYQLTPQEITSLLGANNLWADTGDSEVEYRADAKLYITKKITEAVSALS